MKLAKVNFILVLALAFRLASIAAATTYLQVAPESGDATSRPRQSLLLVVEPEMSVPDGIQELKEALQPGARHQNRPATPGWPGWS